MDVTMDLGNKQHFPCRKPDQVIEYINIDSNHPPHVLKNTVAEVAKRLSALSSKGPEQEALRRVGYTEELIYRPEEEASRQGYIYIYTRSLGALRAPTSSLRPFGPL